MTFNFKYIVHYKKKNVTFFQDVNGIDKTHALKVLKNWLKTKYKGARWVDIKPPIN